MTKRASLLPAGLPDWNPDSKDLWHYNFEKELVNDEKWSCLVTAAVQAEVEDEECIQVYTECVNTGLREAVRIISMADVIRLLKENLSMSTDKKENKNSKPEKQERKSLKPSSPRPSQILELAAKHATFSDFECKLPPDLMAAVLKYMVLNLKDENCFKKKMDAVRQRKNREQSMKAKFIRELKPYEMSQEENKSDRKFSGNILEWDHPINDELVGGPDLYVVLTDFYDPSLFPELLKMNMPFLAILKISTPKMTEKMQTSSVSVSKWNAFAKKKILVSSFWEELKEACIDGEKKAKFKEIAVLHYKAPYTPPEPNPNYCRIIFDELTWMLYSIYRIYRQHQKYLQELCVQRVILSLEPLDLYRCEVYNKLCDVLITGDSLTPLLVLYAIVEQVVVGVPETNRVTSEYVPQLSNFFPTRSESNSTEIKKTSATRLVTPCKTCRDKKHENACEKLKKSFSENLSSLKSEWTETSEKTSTSSAFFKTGVERNSSLMSEKMGKTDSSESFISECLIDQVMSERKTEREMRKQKNWKTPNLCFYGDLIFIQTYFCDPRLVDSEAIIDRFLKALYFPRIWSKYPKLSLAERAFYNFHYFSLWKISEERDEILKLKIAFAILMKLIGISKSYLFRGEEDSSSEIELSMNKENKEQKTEVKFDLILSITQKEYDNFNSFFFNTFIQSNSHRKSAKTTTEVESTKEIKNGSGEKMDVKLLHRAKAHFSVYDHSKNCSSQDDFDLLESKENLNYFKKKLIKENPKVILDILHSVLDCLEISSVTENHVLADKDDYLDLVHDFKYYENLKPNLMIQRFFELQDCFNTVQCSYFSPTDAFIVIMYNDFDHRRIFFRNKCGVLPTPVTFRDFYSYVYPEIKDWLTKENEEYLKFVAETEKKAKEEQEKNDLLYWAQLKKQYCELSDEKRKAFLETNVEVELEPVILEKELGDLPLKPEFYSFSEASFITTNLTDVRIETNQKDYEFYSLDGTEVSASVETWLNATLSLLKVKIKKSKLVLQYNQSINEEKINPSFTVKTLSDMIFVFDKEVDQEEMDDSTYQVKISWPTGLLIQPIPYNSSVYIKQGYLKPYKKGWDIEEETSRCFLKNGQMIIFKENGSLVVLCASGTKYIFYESVPKYDIISTTGEIWEVRTKGPCKKKRKLIGTNKIFIGVDPKTQETFYRREDGVYFMLWPNGCLVTNYPDGTKITSVPYIEEKELTLEWTEEEKLLFEEFELKPKSDISFQDRRSRTILRNSSGPKSIERKSFVTEGFASVSCSYLVEHPKYSSFFFNPEDLSIKLTMPEKLNIIIYPQGNYEIQQERDFIEICDSRVKFYTTCDDCKNQSTATLNINSDEILCKFIDFFKKAFFVFRNGHTTYRDFYMESVEEKEEDDYDFMEVKKQSSSFDSDCPKGHKKNLALAQRCFTFGRDLNGLEFIHADCFGYYCGQLPEETYFDVNLEDPLNNSCTFSSPYYKIGYEKWSMDYENNENSLPVNLKKKDLKELGTTTAPKNLFKYPFPYQRVDRQQYVKLNRNINMPKIIVCRTIRCFPQDPDSIIEDLQKYITEYQKRAHDICNEYKAHKPADSRRYDSRYVEMRLRKIALTLNQSFRMYPHLCTQLPSTEKDIHYFGHFINTMEGLKVHFQNETNVLPECKQIPKPLPRRANFPSVVEESETSQDI